MRIVTRTDELQSVRILIVLILYRYPGSSVTWCQRRLHGFDPPLARSPLPSEPPSSPPPPVTRPIESLANHVLAPLGRVLDTRPSCRSFSRPRHWRPNRSSLGDLHHPTPVSLEYCQSRLARSRFPLVSSSNPSCAITPPTGPMTSSTVRVEHGYSVRTSSGRSHSFSVACLCSTLFSSISSRKIAFTRFDSTSNRSAFSPARSITRCS